MSLKYEPAYAGTPISLSFAIIALKDGTQQLLVDPSSLLIYNIPCLFILTTQAETRCRSTGIAIAEISLESSSKNKIERPPLLLSSLELSDTKVYEP